MTEREMARKKAAARKARKERERKQRNRRVVMTVALMLVVCVASIGGTIAWLTDSTETVQNTFSPTDIDIKLEELNKDASSDDVSESFELIPGKAYSKNPKVTVMKNSETCWLFVKMIETNNPSNYIDYAFNEGTEGDKWEKLEAGEGETLNGVTPGETVYYRVVEESTEDWSRNLLTNVAGDDSMTDGSVKIKTTLTKENMPNENAEPSISFEAYAIQKHSFDSPVAAWNELNPASTGN